MKAKLVESMPSSGGWIYEIKFDGYRALALRGGSETRILSRNQKDLGGKFPEVKDSIAALNIQDAIIDGEIVALDEKGRSSFQLLQGFDMGQERPPIVFYAFDLLRLNGKDLQGLPIEERKANLEELLRKPLGVIRYSSSFTKDIPELLDRARSLGLEGLKGLFFIVFLVRGRPRPSLAHEKCRKGYGAPGLERKTKNKDPRVKSLSFKSLCFA
jgi:bifunctional non-homologous end joining protein LigD